MTSCSLSFNEERTQLGSSWEEMEEGEHCVRDALLLKLKVFDDQECGK